MTKKSIIADTGDVERLPADNGKMMYVISWPGGVQRPRGRPVEKDWSAMLHWLVAKVGKDGLPLERGGQATVEGWVSQWFIDQDLDVTESLVREHVRKVYEALAGLGATR